MRSLLLQRLRAEAGPPALLLGLTIGGCGGGESPPPAAGAREAAADEGPRAPGWILETPVYTPEQAERGAEVFGRICSNCHVLEDFTASQFRRNWAGGSVGDLYRFASTAMPKDNPGGLEPEQYADVLSFVLRENGVPAGEEELGTDPSALGRHRLELPPEPLGGSD